MKDKVDTIVKRNSSCDLHMKQIPLHSQVNISLEYTPEIINELFRKEIF